MLGFDALLHLNLAGPHLTLADTKFFRQAGHSDLVVLPRLRRCAVETLQVLNTTVLLSALTAGTGYHLVLTLYSYWYPGASMTLATTVEWRRLSPISSPTASAVWGRCGVRGVDAAALRFDTRLSGPLSL